MTLQDIQQQALQLPNTDKWELVKALLDDLQQQSDQPLEPSPSPLPPEIANQLTPWVKKLMGIIQLKESEDPKELYIDYLEEKYR